MITIGIDPGKDGFVSVLEDGEYSHSWPTPMRTLDNGKTAYSVWAMKALLSPYSQDWERYNDPDKPLVILEKQQSFHKQGVVSTFSTGQGYGLWEGILVGLGMRYEIVTAKAWQKDITKDVPGDDPKARSILACSRLFSDVDLRRTPRCTTPHDGKADSILIAWYGHNFLAQKD